MLCVLETPCSIVSDRYLSSSKSCAALRPFTIPHPNLKSGPILPASLVVLRRVAFIRAAFGRDPLFKFAYAWYNCAEIPAMPGAAAEVPIKASTAGTN